ncbi:hypothetical protein ACFYYN_22755 [Streptomyces sp. NPDC001902]
MAGTRRAPAGPSSLTPVATPSHLLFGASSALHSTAPALDESIGHDVVITAWWHAV